MPKRCARCHAPGWVEVEWIWGSGFSPAQGTFLHCGSNSTVLGGPSTGKWKRYLPILDAEMFLSKSHENGLLAVFRANDFGRFDWGDRFHIILLPLDSSICYHVNPASPDRPEAPGRKSWFVAPKECPGSFPPSL